jgi:hypothetical protein
MTNTAEGSPTSVSYYTLRSLIGVAGFALPFAVWIGALALDGETLLGSISTYYYSSTRDIFVGTLIVIGVFLATYRGYTGKHELLWGRISDNALTNVAGIAAVGIAVFPTAACETTRCTGAFRGAPWTEAAVVHPIHLASAALFFIAMGVMARFAFTKSDRTKPGGERRHKVYVITGTVILGCAVAMGVYGLLPGDVQARIAPYRPIFVGEAVGIWAFGIAWLTKGRALQTGREMLDHALKRFS